MAIIRCSYCGDDNPDSAKFCETCGNPLTSKSKAGVGEKIEKNSKNGNDIKLIHPVKPDGFQKIQSNKIPENTKLPSGVILTNPYIAGNPVGDSSALIGREDILIEVRCVLKDPNQNAITLFGQRRIGKTSLLQYLEVQLPQKGPYRTVYFDLQDRAAKSLDDVLIELAQTISQRLNIATPDLQKDTRQAFHKKWLPNVLKSMPAGQSLVLLFDEFDVLADPQGGQAARDFFPYLRSLLALNRQRLQFIFVLGRNIGDLNQIALSLLKGVPDRRVSLFNKEETESLVKLAEQNNTLRWNTASIQTVWQLTSGHPYLTQAICWEVWERMRRVFTLIALDEMPTLIVQKSFDLEKLRNSISNFPREFKLLEGQGFIISDDVLPSGWRVSAQVMLWWMADELITALRENDELGQFLTVNEWDGLFTKGEKQQFISAISEVGKMAKSGAEVFIKAAAEVLEKV